MARFQVNEDEVMRDSFEMSAEDMTFGASVVADRSTVPALTASGDTQVVMSATDEQIVELLKERHVIDPKVFDERQPYFWPLQASSTRLDSYDTRMDPDTTLKNYAEDARDGVAFCDSHEHAELNFGRSFAGLFVEGQRAPEDDNANASSVYAAFYTFPDLKLNRVNTNDLIFGIRSGLTKDASVGYKPGRGFMYRCSICGRDLWDWDCDHIPGVEETVVVNQETGDEEQRYAFAWVVNARLSEVSACYDGATPKAMIIKATRMARAGIIHERAARFVEKLARMSLPGTRPFLTGNAKSERSRMADEDKDKAKENERKARSEERSKTLRSLATALKLKDVSDDTSTDELSRVVNAEVASLQQRAQRGDTLFEKLVESACAEGVRALGDKFDKDKQRKTLMKLDVEDIENMRNSWAAQAGDKKNLTGGRKTKDERDPDAHEDDDEHEDSTRDANSTSYLDDDSFMV